MSELLDAVEANRDKLTLAQKAAVRQLQRHFARIARDLEADYNRFLRAWEDATLAAGNGDVPAGWAQRSSEYQALIARYRADLEQIAHITAKLASEGALGASKQGESDARKLAEMATKIAENPAITATIFTSSSVSEGPLASLIAARAPVAAQHVGDIIVSGIARGINPRVTARLIREAAGGEFANSVMVVRTEQMRAYREANYQSYMANPAVQQWRWYARCSSRTCAACWAMHGTIHPATERLESHPNCMCVPIPDVPDIDYGPTGPERFGTEPAAVQRKVLGPTAYQAYKAGAIRIGQLATPTTSPKWGGGLTRTPLDQLLTPGQKSKYLAQARKRRTV